MKRRLPPAVEVPADLRADEDDWLEHQIRWARAAACSQPWNIPEPPRDAELIDDWRLVVEAYEAHGMALPMACPTGRPATRSLYRSVSERLAKHRLPCPPPWDPRLTELH